MDRPPYNAWDNLAMRRNLIQALEILRDCDASLVERAKVSREIEVLLAEHVDHLGPLGGR